MNFAYRADQIYCPERYASLTPATVDFLEDWSAQLDRLFDGVGTLVAADRSRNANDRATHRDTEKGRSNPVSTIANGNREPSVRRLTLARTQVSSTHRAVVKI